MIPHLVERYHQASERVEGHDAILQCSSCASTQLRRSYTPCTIRTHHLLKFSAGLAGRRGGGLRHPCTAQLSNACARKALSNSDRCGAAHLSVCTTPWTASSTSNTKPRCPSRSGLGIAPHTPFPSALSSSPLPQSFPSALCLSLSPLSARAHRFVDAAPTPRLWLRLWLDGWVAGCVPVAGWTPGWVAVSG